jgi:hypothetical protein
MKAYKVSVKIAPKQADRWFWGCQDGETIEAESQEAAQKILDDKCREAGTDKDPNYDSWGPAAVDHCTEQWWKFAAWNEECRYGYGTHAEAVQYCDILNARREINLYYIEDSDRPDSDLCDYWNNISDDLAAIHDEEAAQ